MKTGAAKIGRPRENGGLSFRPRQRQNVTIASTAPVN